ncbi:TPA: DUF726 domain-containing protein [Morganella morganii]|nr:DUF726 domain-containing protein [Morganella morganii]
MFFGKEINIGSLGKNKIKITVTNEESNGVPIVIAPGFLTEHSEDWENFLKKHINTKIIYVNWQSSSALLMAKRALFSMLPSWTSALYTLGPGWLRAGGVLTSLWEIYKVWSRAADEANSAGVALARFLNDVWDDDDKGIFIGHSLGVRVITAAMASLKSDNILSSISIAGAIDVDEYEDRIKKTKCQERVKHTNIFSDNDAILKYLYIPAELSFSPLGLEKSKLPCVNNILTDIGHTEYHDKEMFSEMIIDLYNDALNK